MVLSADALSFQEFMNREALPLATLHNAIFEFLRDRTDVVIFGAQAVNAYVGEPRMTQDIDLLALEAESLAEAIRNYLSETFYIAVRVRSVKDSLGYRVYQIQRSGNRHLLDIRQVDTLPPSQIIEGIFVMAPVALIASKVIAYQQRRGKPKAGTDWRDLAMLLLQFPELKTASGLVSDRLQQVNANPAAIDLWQEIVATPIEPETEDDDFDDF